MCFTSVSRVISALFYSFLKNATESSKRRNMSEASNKNGESSEFSNINKKSKKSKKKDQKVKTVDDLGSNWDPAFLKSKKKSKNISVRFLSPKKSSSKRKRPQIKLCVRTNWILSDFYCKKTHAAALYK